MGSIPFGVVKWLELIWKADLPANSKYLASYLRTYMNDKSDMAWPSYARIIGETGLSKSTVAKYLQYLEAEEWLIRDKGNSTKNTRYHACIPKIVSEKMISDAIGGSSSHVLGSTTDGLRSASHELGVVRHTDTNKQYNNQGNKQEKKNKPESKIPPCDHQGVIGMYNEKFPELSQVMTSMWDGERKVKLSKAWKRNSAFQDLAFWSWYFDSIRLSDQWPFYTGNNDRGWKADIEYFIRPSVMTRLIEKFNSEAANV